MPGREKLTDKQKKQVIARYVELQNYNAVAREFNVANNTVKRLVLDNPDVSHKITVKKEENTQDILEFLETKNEMKKKILENALILINNKMVSDKLSVSDLIRIYGTLTDKEIGMKELVLKQESNSNTQQINENIVNIATLINNPRPSRKLSDYDE